MYVYISLSFFLSVHGEMMDNCGKYPEKNWAKGEEDEERRIVENKLSSCTRRV